MNTAIATTLISVLGVGLFGGLYGMLFHYMRDLSVRFSGLERKLDDNTAAVKDLEIRLTDKFTGQIRELDAKFTGHINAQGQRIDGIYDALRDHGERLARIEAKLDIDPTAEAA